MRKFFLITAVFLITAGCINKSSDTNTAEYNIYSDKSNWLNLPDNITHNADVFYIYPTVCASDTSNKCSIDNMQMQNSAKRVIKLQADAFSKYANIFAPYYTQYDIDVFEYSNYNDIQKTIKDNIQGLNEIYDALDYYFKNYNNGRPFILVSHSQGSAVMQYVLSDYMKKHTEYYKNMVAAYVIGYPVTKEFIAENGENGHGANSHGKKGQDLVIKVPVGTEVFFDDEEEASIDFTEVGQEVVIAKGGNGGFGNAYFKSSVNQAPRRANPGQAGEEFDLFLKLKILSDVGLIGLPNAGKSTFLSVVSKAKPKIADYPFTTLEPQLGVVSVDDYDFVIADLPGLIEGASEGKGLGDRFLKHSERCSVLLHLIDSNSEDVVNTYKIIRKELQQYSKKLFEKQEVIALTKCDSLTQEDLENKKKELQKVINKDTKIFVISSVARIGLTEVLRELKSEVIKVKENNI